MLKKFTTNGSADIHFFLEQATSIIFIQCDTKNSDYQKLSHSTLHRLRKAKNLLKDGERNSIIIVGGNITNSKRTYNLADEMLKWVEKEWVGNDSANRNADVLIDDRSTTFEESFKLVGRYIYKYPDIKQIYLPIEDYEFSRVMYIAKGISKPLYFLLKPVVLGINFNTTDAEYDKGHTVNNEAWEWLKYTIKYNGFWNFVRFAVSK